jgi:hypothetical protein
METRCNNTQEVVLSLRPVDGGGQPVKLDADAVKIEATASIGDPATASVSQKEDGTFEVILRSGDAPGETDFKLSGDALPGEGVEIIEEVITLTVVQAAAVSLGITTLSVRQKSPLSA